MKLNLRPNSHFARFIFPAIFVLGLILQASAELPAGYQNFTPERKQAILWQKIENSEYQNLPPIPAGGWGSIFQKLKSFLTLRETFDTSSDEMPASRGKTKFIHPSGTVFKVLFKPSNTSGYTGIFSQNSQGLARLSLAGNPADIGSYTPGMALKFFIKGQPSVNVAVMYSLEGQGANQNFFKYAFSNHIPKPSSLTLKILGEWFALFVRNPFVLSMDHFAAFENNGLKVQSPKSPWQVVFEPNHQLDINPNSKSDFRIELAQIKPSSLLYTVKAKEKSNSSLVVIGELFAVSRGISSEYGDHSLFFQHRE